LKPIKAQKKTKLLINSRKIVYLVKRIITIVIKTITFQEKRLAKVAIIKNRVKFALKKAYSLIMKNPKANGIIKSLKAKFAQAKKNTLDAKNKIAVAKAHQAVTLAAKISVGNAKRAYMKAFKKKSSKKGKKTKKVIISGKVQRKFQMRASADLKVVQAIKKCVKADNVIAKKKGQAIKARKIAQNGLKIAIKLKKGVKSAKNTLKKAKSIVKKLVLTGNMVTALSKRIVKKEAKIMKIKVKVSAKNCKCGPMNGVKKPKSKKTTKAKKSKKGKKANKAKMSKKAKKGKKL